MVLFLYAERGFMPENSFDGFQREVIERLTRIDGKLDGYDAMKKTTYDNRKILFL